MIRRSLTLTALRTAVAQRVWACRKDGGKRNFDRLCAALIYMPADHDRIILRLVACMIRRGPHYGRGTPTLCGYVSETPEPLSRRLSA